MFAFAGSALTRQNMNESQTFGFEFGTVGARLGKKLVKEQTLSGDFRVCHLVHTMQCSYASSLVLSVLKKFAILMIRKLSEQ